MELDPRIIKDEVRKAIEISIDIFFFPPAIPPEIDSRTLSSSKFSDKTNIRSIAIAVSGSILAASFILVAIYVIVWQHSRRRRQQRQFGAAAAAAPEDGGGVWQDFMIGIGEEPYHVWYIKTAGLDEPTIEAISVVPYKKGEGLVDGSDCAVCLAEFQEEEMLRLLPKCNHAFHIPCIDTWLRSHINCPICRALIMDPNPCSSSSDHAIGIISADQASGEEHGDAQPLPSAGNSTSAVESEIWAQIDLANEDQTSEITKEERKNGEFQPVNRSISMDSALPRFQIRKR